MTQKREKSITLKQLGKKLNLNDSDISMAKKTIGINVKAPKNKCEDKHCPFHGEISVRGRTFKGVVLSTGSQKSATVGWDWLK